MKTIVSGYSVRVRRIVSWSYWLLSALLVAGLIAIPMMVSFNRGFPRSFMTLIGEKTWYMPRWLDRLLPNLTIEPPHEREEPVVGRERTGEPEPTEA